MDVLAERKPPAVAVRLVEPPFRTTPSTEAVPSVAPSATCTTVELVSLTVAISGWKTNSVTATPPRRAGMERATVTDVLCRARTFTGEGRRDSEGCTTRKSAAFEVWLSVGLTGSGLTTRTGNVPSAERSAAVRLTVKRLGLTKVV